MEIFPLQLNYYYFTNTVVRANPNSNIGAHDIHAIHKKDIQIDYKFLEEDEENDFQCILTTSSSKNLPYEFQIEIVGHFSLNNMNQDDISYYLLNAPATLFSIVREQIASISANGPYRKLVLPLIDVRSFELDKIKKSTQKKTTRKKS